MVSAIADLLTKVKELIINGTAKVCDVIFTSGKMAWTKVVMPKVQAIVRKTKNVFAGFINWASNLYNCGNDGQSLSYAWRDASLIRECIILAVLIRLIGLVFAINLSLA